MYEKFNHKSGIHENGDIASSIEKCLLYNMYSLVFSPTLVSKESTVKTIFYLNGWGFIRPHIGSLDFLFPVKSNHICDESIRSGRHFDTK